MLITISFKDQLYILNLTANKMLTQAFFATRQAGKAVQIK